MDPEDSPDLDHGPEIYETSDVESETLLSHKDDPNENIARDPLVLAKDASSAFEASVITDDLAYIDFLGTVAQSLTRLGYNVGATETRLQKLARIAQELDQLQKADQTSEIDQLRLKLAGLKGLQGLDAEFDMRISEIFQEIDSALAPIADVETQKTVDVLRLEERIAQLEDMVGSGDEPPASLQNAIKSLARKVSILFDHESELEAVKTEIKLLTKEMEALAASKRMAQVTSGSKEPVNLPISFDHKVSALFDRLAEFDKVNSTVPHIIARLKSLNHIHNESGNAVECVTTLDTTLGAICQDMKKWDESIEKIDQSIQKQSSAFDRNTEVFERKMEAVLERISKLEARK